MREACTHTSCDTNHAAVTHGRSNVKAIQNAIRVCKESVERGVVQTIREGVKNLPGGESQGHDS